MLGRLCRLMRICGIDTEYSNQGIKILLEARREGRIILTKNRRLLNQESTFFIEPDEPLSQIKEVIDKFNLHKEISPFSRCLLCNEKLKPVNKESIKEKVPYFTYKNFDEFAQCERCQRVYWKGTHYQRMMKELKTILDKKIG